MPLAVIHNTRANWGPTAEHYLPERWLQPGADFTQTAADADTGSKDGQDGPRPAAASANRSFEMDISRAKVRKRVILLVACRARCCGGGMPDVEWLAGTLRSVSKSRACRGLGCVYRPSGQPLKVVCCLLSVQPEARVKRFMPFSDGRRDCIGQALAKMNNATVLATLLSRFHFELAPEVKAFYAVRYDFMYNQLVILSSMGRSALLYAQHGGGSTADSTSDQTCGCLVHCASSPPHDVIGCTLCNEGSTLCMQAGGAEGVAAKEHMAITLQPGGKLRMLVTHRAS